MVSVVLPNYNHAPYLEQRINSILNQTYQDFELIILDDCSTDNSKEIIEKYRNNSHVSHIIYNEINSGSTFKQWRKGIDIALGEYIWIAESDDYSDETFLAKSMYLLQNIKDCALVFTQSFIVDSQNKIIEKRNSQISDDQYIKSSKFVRENMLFWNSLYNASMVVFKKESANSVNWERICKMKYSGDWLFWSEALLSQDVNLGFINENLNYYRVHNANVSNRSQKKGLYFIEGFDISTLNAKRLHIKRDKYFRQTWFDLCIKYRKQFNIPIFTHIKIGMLFIIKQPKVIFCMLRYAKLKLR